jgi:Na+/phosphate symporter
MSDCSKHKKTVEKYNGSLQELAWDIGDLHYEALTYFLIELKAKLNKDSNKDNNYGRVQLADKLSNAGDLIEKASEEINKAWKLSKPYMEKKDETISTKTT